MKTHYSKAINFSHNNRDQQLNVLSKLWCRNLQGNTYIQNKQIVVQHIQMSAPSKNRTRDCWYSPLFTSFYLHCDDHLALQTFII